jgi:hypothetical protein
MKPLKFIHITKNAGTSIENAGKAKGLQWGLYHTEYGLGHITPDSGWHHEVTTRLPLSLINQYDWFMVVRNPYTRILSEYHCKWAGPPASSTVGPMNFLKHNKQKLKESMNEYLIQKIRNAPAEGHHYTPQALYLHPTAKIHVLKFENIQAEFDALMATYGIEGLVLKRENSKEKRFRISDFSRELIALINEVYHEDFVQFGYRKL